METKTTVGVKLSPVTFHVFRKDGSKNPDIKLYFLEKLDVTAHDAMEGWLKLQDGTIWKLCMEEPVRQALKAADKTYCIVSFQARVDGNFAVARLYSATHKAAKRT